MSPASPRRGGGFSPRRRMEGELALNKAPSINAHERTAKARLEFHIAARKRNHLVRVFESSGSKTSPYLLTLQNVSQLKLSDSQFGEDIKQQKVSTSTEYYMQYSLTLYNLSQDVKESMAGRSK